MIRKLELLLLAGALCVVAVFSLNWAIKTTIHSKKDVTVPDLVGQPILDVLTTLSDQNLGLRKEGSEFDESVPAGTILRQQPVPGISVREGKIIRVTISQGGETVFVPDVVGQSLRSAEISLRQNLLALGEIHSRPSLKYEKDFVVSQKPVSRTILTKNSFILLVISEGPPEDGTILMPEFIGKNRSAIEKWSKDTRVKIKITEDASSSESETVLQQELEPDTPVRPGKTVRFVVASKKEGAFIPEGGDFSSTRIHFEVPQGESAKQYRFVLIDESGSREVWRGNPQPGSKLDIPLPQKISPSARVRIFVNGILTGERSLN